MQSDVVGETVFYLIYPTAKPLDRAANGAGSWMGTYSVGCLNAESS